MPKEAKIGIFEGRKKSYNLTVLEILFKDGPSKSWEIAKKIRWLRGKTQNADIEYSRTQKIYSVLIRKKGGRLYELEEKGYILKDNKDKWELTAKGLIAVLIKKKEIIKEIYPLWLEFDFEELQFLIMRGSYTKEKLKELKSFRIFGLAKITERIALNYGIDLDRISETALYYLINSRIEESENPENAEDIEDSLLCVLKSANEEHSRILQKSNPVE